MWQMTYNSMGLCDKPVRKQFVWFDGAASCGGVYFRAFSLSGILKGQAMEGQLAIYQAQWPEADTKA